MPAGWDTYTPQEQRQLARAYLSEGSRFNASPNSREIKNAMDVLLNNPQALESAKQATGIGIDPIGSQIDAMLAVGDPAQDVVMESPIPQTTRQLPQQNPFAQAAPEQSVEQPKQPTVAPGFGGAMPVDLNQQPAEQNQSTLLQDAMMYLLPLFGLQAMTAGNTNVPEQNPSTKQEPSMKQEPKLVKDEKPKTKGKVVKKPRAAGSATGPGARRAIAKQALRGVK